MLLSLLLASSALLFGVADSVAVMSVDLGAEWMKVAVVTPGVPMEIALNAESKRKTAVAVSIKDGDRWFGSDALNICVRFPKNCYFYLLDLVGKKFDHSQVELFRARFPHYEMKAHPERGTVLFQHDAETVYSPEELLAMILQHAAKIASDFTEQAVKDVVVTVPVFMSPAERRSMAEAVELAGLNCLQLISEPMAVAVNYGMFRRKEITKKAKYYMFYDMGAQDTTATIVEYQEVKTYDRGFSQTHPQAKIVGLGFDRNLGGLDIQIVIRDYLAKKFNELGKTKTDVTKVPRAMGKLFKEAGKVKNVLSANAETNAQVENVMEDIDLKTPVSRKLMLELAGGFFEHVTDPIKMALETWGGTMEEISEVILVGGGTRVPKVQEALLRFFAYTKEGGMKQRELGKSLNTDEAAAMGAVFKAADLSAGFKVKKFLTKEGVVFPVSMAVGDERHTFLPRMSHFPVKKAVTFDEKLNFEVVVSVNENELEHLKEDEVALASEAGPLYSLSVKGVAEVFAKHAAANIKSKGVRAHFGVDESGAMSVSAVEVAFEKTISVEDQELEEKEKEAEEKRQEEEEEANDTWNKLGDTISNFFSGDEDAKVKEKEKREKERKAKEKKKKEKEKKKAEAKKKQPPKKPKTETFEETLEFDFRILDLQPLGEAQMSDSKAKLKALSAFDATKKERETALNALESLVVEVRERLEDSDGIWRTSATDSEVEKLSKKCDELSAWIDEEVTPATDAKAMTDKHQELQDLTLTWASRAKEHLDRPEAMGALNNMITSSEKFLKQAKNISEGDYFFNGTDLAAFEVALNEVKQWKEEAEARQNGMKNYETPYLKSAIIAEKGIFLDTEVKRILHAAVLDKNERTARRKVEREEEREHFKQELLKAKAEIRERRLNLEKSQQAAADARAAYAKAYAEAQMQANNGEFNESGDPLKNEDTDSVPLGASGMDEDDKEEKADAEDVSTDTTEEDQVKKETGDKVDTEQKASEDTAKEETHSHTEL